MGFIKDSVMFFKSRKGGAASDEPTQSKAAAKGVATDAARVTPSAAPPSVPPLANQPAMAALEPLRADPPNSVQAPATQKVAASAQLATSPKTSASTQLCDRRTHVLGELVSVLSRTKMFEKMTLSDLASVAGPAITTEQIAIATAHNNDRSASTPVAAVLWATVSTSVDKRLSETLDRPVRLTPMEWTSGDIPWIILSAGDPRVLGPLLTSLSEKSFKGRPLRVRVAGKDGRFMVQEIKPESAASPAS